MENLWSSRDALPKNSHANSFESNFELRKIFFASFLNLFWWKTACWKILRSTRDALPKNWHAKCFSLYFELRKCFTRVVSRISFFWKLQSIAHAKTRNLKYRWRNRHVMFCLLYTGRMRLFWPVIGKLKVYFLRLFEVFLLQSYLLDCDHLVVVRKHATWRLSLFTLFGRQQKQQIVLQLSEAFSKFRIRGS